MHMYYIKNGANFSVPGSGKTTVVLYMLEKIKLEDNVNTLILISPF